MLYLPYRLCLDSHTEGGLTTVSHRIQVRTAGVE